MKSILAILVLFFVSNVYGQQSVKSPRVSAEAFRTEIANTIASYPNGEERYREVDNFRRLIQALAAHKLGMTRDDFRDMMQGTKSTSPRPTSFSQVSDISPDTSDENETTVAISRTNPNLIVAGANDLYAMYDSSMPAFVSTDGGRSWQTHYLPVVTQLDGQSFPILAFGDPMITCDDQGMFYYSFLISSANDNPSSYISDLMVAHSSDGINWTLGKPIVGNKVHTTGDEDKETIAVDCDPASMHHGRVYIAWRHTSTPNKYQLSYSDDHGMTWSKAKSRTSKYGYFEQIRVGKGGTVFIATNSRTIDYAILSNDTGMHGITVSHDGGQNFQEHYFASYSNYPPIQASYLPNSLKGGIKAYAYTTFDVDPSNNKLYAVYGDYKVPDLPSGGRGYAVQYGVTSTDEGSTWSAPQQIGTPGMLTVDHFQPWVTFDPVIGKTRVSMYSSEEDRGANQLSRMVRFDFDAPGIAEPLGSDLFDPNSVMNPWGGSFIGDYTGGDAYGGTYVAVWTQNDAQGTTGGDIFAYVSNTTGSGVGSQINARKVSVSEVYPNPSMTKAARLAVQSSEATSASIRLVDLSGREVLRTQATLASGENSIELNLLRLPAGIYRATVTAGDESFERNLIVLH